MSEPGPDLMYQRGVARFEAGDLEAAEACFWAIGEPDPHYGDSQAYLGQICLRTGRAEQAAHRLAEACAYRGGADAWLWLGEARLALGDAAGAERALERSLRYEAINPAAHVLLGHCLAARGDLEGASARYELALVQDPLYGAARYYLAETLVKKGDLVRAYGQLHYLLAEDPDYVPGLLLAGDIAFHQGDFRQAIVEYRRASEVEPLSGPVWERLGRAHESLRQQGAALDAYEAAMLAWPPHWPAYLAAARILERRRKRRRALQLYLAVELIPALREEAAAGIARIQEYFSRFDLTDPRAGAPDEPDPPDEPPADPPAREMGPPPTAFRRRQNPGS